MPFDHCLEPKTYFSTEGLWVCQSFNLACLNSHNDALFNVLYIKIHTKLENNANRVSPSTACTSHLTIKSMLPHSCYPQATQKQQLVWLAFVMQSLAWAPPWHFPSLTCTELDRTWQQPSLAPTHQAWAFQGSRAVSEKWGAFIN